MNCTTIRKRLGAEPQPAREIVDHLARCPACVTFRERLQLAREVLSDRPSVMVPDAGFARRVASRVARPSDVLGWAALRLLPASLALAIALGTAARFSPPSEVDAIASVEVDASGSDDVLVWIAQASEDEP